jgi:hypothetical protein
MEMYVGGERMGSGSDDLAWRRGAFATAAFGRPASRERSRE